MQNSREETYLPSQIQFLRKVLFCPQTIEEHFFFENFTPKMLQEVRDFLDHFTVDDAERIIFCKNAKDRIYITAGIIHRIQ